jgi:outer membrane autotransporter protein
MMSNAFCARLAAAILPLVAALSSPAYASLPSGCDGINGAPYPLSSTATPPVLLMGVTDLKIGDTITITAHGLSSTGLQLQDSLGNIVLQFGALSPSATTRQFTVSNAAESTLYAYSTKLSVSGPYQVVVSSGSCHSAPPPSPSGKDASQAITKGFLAARINGILLNDPGATSLMNRSNSTVPTGVASAGSGATSVASNAAAFGNAMGLGSSLGSGLGNAMGLGAGTLGDDAIDTSGGRTVQFSQSLSAMRRQAAQAQQNKDRMALGGGDGSALPLAYEGASPWDFWVEGRYSAFDDDSANLDRNGHVGVLYAGVDYRFGNNVLAGFLVQFDWSKDDTGALSSKIDGNGWMVGPYVSARLHENIFVDLRAAWGGSNNDLTLGDTTGTFDTTRWLVKGTLAGNWIYDAWRFTPTAELAYVEEHQNVFTNSAGNVVEGQTVSLGRLEFGPEVGYRFAHSATTFVEPFAAIKGVWDFDNPNVAIIDGFTVGPGDFWGRLQGGLNVVTTNGLYVRGLASWDGLGTSDYNGYTLQGTVNVPLN